MRLGQTLAFVMVALLSGGIVSQLPLAVADDSNILFSALWDAIFDLQGTDESLQAQIDELRAERDALLTQTGNESAFVSNVYTAIEVEVEDGHTLIYITAGNSGPDRAAGVKMTAFYVMPLFQINSIDGGLCQDKSRGIIECIIGTLEEDQESMITIDATPRESGKANTWTVNISTTTDDSDYSNNYVTYKFETGSGELVKVPKTDQPIEEEPEASEPEPDDNKATNSTEIEEPQESMGNQTSSETIEDNNNGSNSTNRDNEESESVGNQTSTEEKIKDTGSNSTNAEAEDTRSEQPEESTSEESGTDESSEGTDESGESSSEGTSESEQEKPNDDEESDLGDSDDTEKSSP